MAQAQRTGGAEVAPVDGPAADVLVAHFVQAVNAARDNLQHAVDFVVLHEGHDVDGPTPAASLNRPTVLAAVAAWERFMGDVAVLAHGHEWLGPGQRASNLAESYLVRPPVEMVSGSGDQTIVGQGARMLQKLTGGPEIVDGLSVKVVSGWSGASPRMRLMSGTGLRGPEYVRPRDRWEPLTTGEAVYQSVKLRNAIAHAYLPAMGEPRAGKESARAAEQRLEDKHWLNEPTQLFWQSDKRDGLSVQAGCARGVLALFIQLVDQVAVAVAAALPDPDQRHSVLANRLPEEWFSSVYPAGTRRSVDRDLRLWRGSSLVRLQPYVLDRPAGRRGVD